MRRDLRRARALLASAAARAARNPEDPSATAAVVERRRDYRAAALAEQIRQVVDGAPPLTAEQIEQLRGLLPAPAASPGDAAEPDPTGPGDAA